jgi:hypothetical protein
MDPDTHDAARCLDCEALLTTPEQVASGRCDPCHFGEQVPTSLPTEVPVSPDCLLAKHQACNGDAWDNRLDAMVMCWCGCHQEVP